MFLKSKHFLHFLSTLILLQEDILLHICNISYLASFRIHTISTACPEKSTPTKSANQKILLLKLVSMFSTDWNYTNTDNVSAVCMFNLLVTQWPWSTEFCRHFQHSTAGLLVNHHISKFLRNLHWYWEVAGL